MYIQVIGNLPSKALDSNKHITKWKLKCMAFPVQRSIKAGRSLGSQLIQTTHVTDRKTN